MKILKSEIFKENLIAFSISNLCLIVIYYLHRYFSGMSSVKQMKFALSNTSMFQPLFLGLFIVASVALLFSGGSFMLAHSWKDSVVGLCFFVYCAFTMIMSLGIIIDFGDVGQTPEVVQYVTGQRVNFQAIPKSKFLQKTVVKSDNGYTRIDGNKFVVNGNQYVINTSDNIIVTKRSTDGHVHVKVTTYKWKKNTPKYIKNAYYNFAQQKLNVFDKIEITE